MYMYICINVYIYIHIYTHTHTHTHITSELTNKEGEGGEEGRINSILFVHI
jgi:hypothetical protein